jgi:hypothetical protein
MVAHTAEGVDAVMVTFYALLQQQIEMIAIGVLKKDIMPAVTPEHYVIETAWEMDTWFTSHVGTMAQAPK